MSERKVPKLRFAGFTDDWKQRKLGDVLTESRILGSTGKNAKKLTVKLWRKGAIAKEDTQSGSEATQYFIRQSGQFIYGKLDFLNQAFAIIPDELNGYESTLDAPAFDIDKSVDANFLLEFIARDTFYLHYGSMANGSRKAKRVHVQTVLNMPFIAPTLAEQQAIGEFFKQLDDTIAFHQREWEKYKNLKISYLEKMFTQENENKPQLRFPNFTDAWKQRKLGEVTVQIKSYSLSRNVETNKDTGFKYVHYGDIHRNIAKLLLSENNLPSIQKGNYEFLQKGDLVIADASEDYEGIGNSCLVDCFLSRNIVAGLHTIALRPTEVNSLFLYYLLHTDIFSQYGKIIATGTKVFGITAKNLLNFEFYLPTETEQQAIGEFFKQLDDTIAFHQRELEKYKNLKNGYLKQMFV